VVIVHSFQDEEVDWLTDEAAFGGFEILREVGEKRCELIGVDATED